MTSKIVIKDRYEVQIEKSLEHLNTPSAKAYAAIDFRSEHKNIFAYVCEPNTIPRVTKVPVLVGFTDNQTSIIAMQVLGIDDKETIRQVFICTMINGEKLANDYKTIFNPWSELKVINTFLKPITQVMIQFLNKKITHRNIRPDNVFVNNDQSHITLGECFSNSAGMNQPSFVEPLEEAMLLPHNRTNGKEQHDIHAITATALFMLLGEHPRPELNETELITERLRYGTTDAYLNGRKMPQRIMEFLRAGLSDIPENRWSIEELFTWANNDRVRLVSNEQLKSARHSFEYSAQKKCHTLPELAHYIRQDQTRAIETLSEGKLPDWITNELQQKELGEYIDLQTRSAPLSNFTSSSVQTQKFLTKITQTIHNHGPLSWKQEMFLPESIGTAITHAAINKEKLNKFNDIIQSGIWEDYLIASQSQHTEAYMIRMKVLNSYLSRPISTQGIERCIYALNKDTPCLSPALNGQPAYSSKDILSILEKTAKQEKRSEFPLDRHISAFLAERDKGAKVNLLKDLTHDNRPKKISAQLSQLAIMQKQSGLKSLPNLCKWASGMSADLINNYKNKETRSALHAKIKDFSAEGNLVKLNQIINNPSRIKKDMEDFRASKNLWKLLNSEIKTTRDKLLNSNKVPVTVGRRVAVSSACMLSITFSAMFMIYHVLR